MQSAGRLELDMHDQAERYRAFSLLQDRDPVALARENHEIPAPHGLVLAHHDGTRFVRTGWFHDHARSLDPSAGGNADIAQRMERVGWRRNGKTGRIKATAPGFSQKPLAWNFFLVPEGWEGNQ